MCVSGDEAMAEEPSIIRPKTVDVLGPGESGYPEPQGDCMLGSAWVWETRGGERLFIPAIPDRHLLNIVRFLLDKRPWKKRSGERGKVLHRQWACVLYEVNRRGLIGEVEELSVSRVKEVLRKERPTEGV
jgi:hypothetical protein